jgi:hypothetical protein
VRAAVSPAVAKSISGHKTLSVFLRYDIVSERDLHDAARKLSNYIERVNGDILVTTAQNSPSIQVVASASKLLN